MRTPEIGGKRKLAHSLHSVRFMPSTTKSCRKGSISSGCLASDLLSAAVTRSSCLRLRNSSSAVWISLLRGEAEVLGGGLDFPKERIRKGDSGLHTGSITAGNTGGNTSGMLGRQPVLRFCGLRPDATLAMASAT